MNLEGIFTITDESANAKVSDTDYAIIYEGRVTEIKNGICYVTKGGSPVSCETKNLANISVGDIVHVIEKNNASTSKDRIVLEGYSSDGGSVSVAWNDITGKPSTYTPSVHEHSISDISQLQTILDSKTNVQSDWNITDSTSDKYIKNKPSIPSKTSQLENDSNYLSSIPSEYVTDTELNAKGYLTSETDPTVPSWAKSPSKPSYTASEVGADPSGSAQTVQENLDDHEGDTVAHLSSTEHTGMTDAILKKHSHTNKSILDGITSSKVSNWDAAKTHADSTHAPTNAEKNIIVGIQKNGADLPVNATTRKVNITVPNYTAGTGIDITDNVISSTDDEITSEIITQMWDEIIGEPGVLQSSIVFSETAPTYKTKNMIYIRKNI